MAVGVLGGTVFFGKQWEKEEFKAKTVRTEFGKVKVFVGQDIIFLPRHGVEESTPPHRINHHANLKALENLGVSYVISVCSTGSLRKEIPPGSLLIPHDFFCLWHIPTFFESNIKHVLPSFDPELRKVLITCARETFPKVIEKGIYVQTLGPRLETKAEVEFLSRFGSVVGMTLANEATLACELELPIAAICSVDNYAHGVGKGKLSQELIQSRATENAEYIATTIKKCTERLK